MKSQDETARAEWKGRGRWRKDEGLKSQIENLGKEWMGRDGCREGGGLNSQIENEGERNGKREVERGGN